MDEVLPRVRRWLEDEARARVDQRGPLSADRHRDRFNDVVEEVVEDAKQIAGLWSTELYADLVAVRLLGPAFLAAFERAVMGGEPAPSHPPRELRLHLMDQYLQAHFPEVAFDPVWQRLRPPSLDRKWKSQ